MKRKKEVLSSKNKNKETFTKTKREFKNSETFAYGTAVDEIPKNKLLVLDEYAFDIDELAQLPVKDLFTNMHTQTEFSLSAKQILVSSPTLGDKAQSLLSQTKLSEPLMKRVYDLGITLLKYGDGKESGEALSNFQALLDTLDSKEQHALLVFVIKMNGYNGRARTNIMSKMIFGDVYSQLNQGNFCVRAAGNWFIQAVRMTHPALIDKAYVTSLNNQSIQAAPVFSFFANRGQVTQPNQPPTTMQKELDEMMQKNKENQEKLSSIVNTL
jgi:hypothetical protein